MKTQVTFKIIPHYESGSVRVSVYYNSPDKGKANESFDIPSSGKMKDIYYPSLRVLRDAGSEKISHILDYPEEYSYSIHMINNPSVYFNNTTYNAALNIMMDLYLIQFNDKLSRIKKADIKYLNDPPKPDTFTLPLKTWMPVKETLLKSIEYSEVSKDADHVYKEQYDIITHKDNVINCLKTVIQDDIEVIKMMRTFRPYFLDDEQIAFIGSGVAVVNTYHTIPKLDIKVKLEIDTHTVVDIILNR